MGNGYRRGCGFENVARKLVGGLAAGYAIPLPPGKMLPPLPAGGFRNPADLARVPGARAIPEGPGRGDTIYAYTKESTHRNICCIPIP